MVDIDGVVSLFGGSGPSARRPSAPFAPTESPEEAGGTAGSFHSIDGIPHFLSSTAAAHLLELASAFDLVWASGWEEKANEYLPHLLGLDGPLPFLRFARGAVAGRTTTRTGSSRRSTATPARGRWPGSTTPSTRPATRGRERVRRRRCW